MNYIKNNPASLALSFGALTVAIFFSLFGGALVVPSIIMWMLGFTGIFLGDKFKAGGEEPEPTPSDFEQIGLLALFGLMTWLILSLFLPEVQFLSGGTVVQFNTFLGAAIPNLTIGAIYSGTWIAAFVFAVFVVPPMEEQFFRVLVGNLATKFGEKNPLFFVLMVPLVGAVPVVALVVVGGLFATFHLAAYGLSYTTLAILWGAGSIMYYVDIRAGDPLPSIFGHAGNNALSFLVGGNILAPYFPNLPHTLNAPYLQLGLPVAMLAYTHRASIGGLFR